MYIASPMSVDTRVPHLYSRFTIFSSLLKIKWGFIPHFIYYSKEFSGSSFSSSPKNERIIFSSSRTVEGVLTIGIKIPM